MKRNLLAICTVMTALPCLAGAQRIQVLPIGAIAVVNDPAPTVWGISGMTIFQLSQSIGAVTPIMRTETFDARIVEILSRTQAPPLRASDIRVVSRNGREIITVRRLLLLEVMPQDARVAKMSKYDLANKWASRLRQVLPQVSPMPNRFGV